MSLKEAARVKWNIWCHFALMMHPKGICKYWHTIWWCNYWMHVAFHSSELLSNVHESQSVPLSAFFQRCILFTGSWYADFMPSYGYVTGWFEPINASQWAIYRYLCSEAQARFYYSLIGCPELWILSRGANIMTTYKQRTTHIAQTHLVDILYSFLQMI